jgi:hypothetical protein
MSKVILQKPFKPFVSLKSNSAQEQDVNSDNPISEALKRRRQSMAQKKGANAMDLDSMGNPILKENEDDNAG